MKRSLRVISLVGFSMLGACAWWMAGRPGLVPRDELIFSHKTHVDNSVECATCHAGVKEASDTAKSLLPKEAACLDCHEKPDNCAMCHKDVAQAKARPEHHSELGFSHQAHMERVGDDCATCHVGIADMTVVPVAVPAMDVCLQCHNHATDYAEARCQHCHPDMRAMPLRAVAEFDHGGNWLDRHGMMARVQGAQCTQCHAQSMCADCHSKTAPAAPTRIFPEQVERALIHRGDWISSHPMEARAEGQMCLRCHQTSYCSSCHASSGLSPKTGAGGRNPHPGGWALSPEHGREARLAIETCAACHDQGAASACVRCHAVDGMGGNPHPAGWKKTHDEDDATKETPCRFCHTR
ncbi:MAG: cytochrome c3 family protein [Myxococcota bacterium]